MPKPLLPEQAAAAYDIDHHVSVTAGPGSGKTTVLVERYLHVLRQKHLSIDQIVAITFTNRAANEMRERLRHELTDILRNADSRERGRWLHFKRTLDGAVITTIHGFCARLLREFPVEAGVDPQFLLLDEHRAAMLLESVVEDVLSTFISGGHEPISRLTLGVGRSKLAAALAQLYRDVRGQGLTLPELTAATANIHAGEEQHRLELLELDRSMNEFLQVPRTTAKAKEKVAEILDAWPSFKQFLETIPAHENLADYCRGVENFRSHRPQQRPPLTNQIGALDELIWGENLGGRVPQICLDMFASQYALEMVNLLSTIEERLNEQKYGISALDFDDLEVRTLQLLERPEIQLRVADRYKFFLVDEFQDTNDLQRRLLERLALAKGRANLFIVGDRKQSIYGFRGADVDVFREMTSLLLEHGGSERPLQLNFRSQPPLISFFNFLFSRLFTVPEEASELSEQDLQELGFVGHELSIAVRSEPGAVATGWPGAGGSQQAQVATETPGAGGSQQAQVATETPGAGDRQQVQVATETPGAGDRQQAQIATETPGAGGSQQAQVATETPGAGDRQQAQIATETPGAGGSQQEQVATGSTPTSAAPLLEAHPVATAPGSDLVELLITTRSSDDEDHKDSRQLDAQQVAIRIKSLMHANPTLNFSDFALLFRAMTQVQLYESVFRRANIPYQTVLGRGFYEREEITDLIQLLRFLDNKTDELALAAVLRSPLCGISDNALLALRSAPTLDQVNDPNYEQGFSSTRNLYRALRQHRELAYINEQEHELLERASLLIIRLISRRHHFTIEALLRFAVEESEYMAIVAANFDGAQRLANIQRLFTLAARFEKSGAQLIRDFVRYVEEFEAIGSRESEGQIDEAANAVRLMTIHQSKGLEFRVVVIPELQRLSRVANDTWVILDRHKGLTLKVPDGRGRLVAGCTYSEFERRHNLREYFESMRLLYVAATRAEDRLILSGVTEQLTSLAGRNDSWIKWIWKTLGLTDHTESGLIELAPDVRMQLTLNLTAPAEETLAAPVVNPTPLADTSGASLIETFPLLGPVEAEHLSGSHRFSVTQLINYQRCARQYYFDRVLRLPSTDELGVWNNAEAPEPPANLTATLKGAVIHRFCEQYTPDQETEECLRLSFSEVVRMRQATLADRLGEIDVEASIKTLLPLANNYLNSDVYRRIESARVESGQSPRPSGELGLWSELPFRLRRPLGVLNGVIDKLLISQSADGVVEVEIIDFKTNRISTVANVTPPVMTVDPTPKRGESQFAFDFDNPPRETVTQSPVADPLDTVARDYRLQMQAYALAVNDLLPSEDLNRVRVTLHFLEPNLEVQLSDDLLERSRCEQAIDAAMRQIVASAQPSEFPVNPAAHCRMCNFLSVCSAGRDYVRHGIETS